MRVGIQNTLDSELPAEGTVKDYLTVQMKGQRTVKLRDLLKTSSSDYDGTAQTAKAFFALRHHTAPTPLPTDSLH